MEDELGRPRRRVTPEPVPLALGRAVDDVVSGGKRLEQRGNFLGGILQVVVDRDDDVVAGGPDGAQERGWLPGGAREVDAPQAGPSRRVVVQQPPPPARPRVVEGDT